MVPNTQTINLNVNLGESGIMEMLISTTPDNPEAIEYRIGEPHAIYQRLLKDSIIERLGHPQVVWIYMRDTI